MFSILARLNSVKLKLATSAYITTFIVLLTTVYVYSYFYEGEQENMFRYRVISVARTASTLIDSDDFVQLKTKEDEKTEVYYHIRKTLQDIKRANPQVLFIYTLRSTPEKNVFEFVVDADKKPYHIGDKYDVSGQAVIKNALKQPTAETDFETNRWGEYLTAYAPILDSTGKTVGIVGVDFAVSTPQEPQEGGRTLAFFAALVAAVAVTTLLIWKSIEKSAKPLSQICDAIKRSSEGRLVRPLTVNSKDEYEDIANHLNLLSASIEQMQKRVQKEVDSSQLNRQKFLNVYSDIIYAATQGKLRLLDNEKARTLTLEGVLYSDSKLESDDDIKKNTDVAQQLLQEKNFSILRISQALTCIKESASNTIKHAGQGLLQFRVMDDFIRIIITDQGPGIDYNNLPGILFLQAGLDNASEKSGFPLIVEFADRTFMATSDEGTIVAMDFEQKKSK